MIFHLFLPLLLLSLLLPIQYWPYRFANIVLLPGKWPGKKEDGVFSDQYVSSWQQYAADHILTFLFLAGSYPAFPATETRKLPHDGKYPRDYKDRRNALIHVTDHLFSECKLYKKLNSYHPSHETLL